MMKDVLGLIMGGGQGARLYPLTKLRAKPAVPLAGKYRLIDIPISNCLHAGIDKIAILTQFNSVSLHRHIQRVYARDMFSDGWVQILAAEQTPDSTNWYQGTADAVRQQLFQIKQVQARYVLILAGDHLYDMDYRDFIRYHIDTRADITMAVQPVGADMAPALGILKRSAEGRILDFVEKPATEKLPNLESLPGTDAPYLASMGIYVFPTDLLLEVLKREGDDFGKHIIPGAISDYRVMGYVYDGYWADIGTIRRFYEVNLEMASPERPFDLYSPGRPIYTRARFLPPSRVHGTVLKHVLLADGCRISAAEITHSVVGLRSIIDEKAVIRSSVIMGADFYETVTDIEENKRLGRPRIGIGRGTHIEAAIIDKNARIGRNVRIRYLNDRPDAETDNWVVRDGLVIIPKNAVIADDTVI
ncbi:MAG: glucose-1-phosphate adenylyltransferase [Desulfobacterales bacterium]|jgi:glucose-1-phosphate adenylyltransferase|nr:glucose-1-phosphate adenylyltransferase [Desulfobacterales bacterium]